MFEHSIGELYNYGTAYVKNAVSIIRFCGNCGNRLPQDTASLIADLSVQSSLPGTVGVMMGADLLERFREGGLTLPTKA